MKKSKKGRVISVAAYYKGTFSQNRLISTRISSGSPENNNLYASRRTRFYSIYGNFL